MYCAHRCWWGHAKSGPRGMTHGSSSFVCTQTRTGSAHSTAPSFRCTQGTRRIRFLWWDMSRARRSRTSARPRCPRVRTREGAALPHVFLFAQGCRAAYRHPSSWPRIGAQRHRHHTQLESGTVISHVSPARRHGRSAPCAVRRAHRLLWAALSFVSDTRDVFTSGVQSLVLQERWCHGGGGATRKVARNHVG